MKLLTRVCALLLIVNTSQSIPHELHEDIFLQPKQIWKRGTNSSNEHSNFVEQKLIQHSQALEQIVGILQINKEMMEQLIKDFSKRQEQPKEEKQEVKQNTRRNNEKYIVEDEEVNPFLRIGKTMPKYSLWLKDVIKQELRRDEDPIPLVDESVRLR